MEVSFVALADKHNEILSVTFKSTVTDHSSPIDDGAVSKTSWTGARRNLSSHGRMDQWYPYSHGSSMTKPPAQSVTPFS